MISDFRKMIVTVMMTTCEKIEPRVIYFKNCNGTNFAVKNLTHKC